MPRPSTAGHFTPGDRIGRWAVVSAGFGFGAGAALGTGFLWLDWFGLRSLMLADDQAFFLMAIFVLGFAVLLSPIGLATASSAAVAPEDGGGSRMATLPACARTRRARH